MCENNESKGTNSIAISRNFFTMPAMKIVYTYGVFDLFHSGHVQLLKEAKALGDKLVVGVYTDEVAESFKRRPLIPLEHRKAVVEAIAFVDEVVIQDEYHPDKNILLLKPHILAKGPGAGWTDPDEKMAGADLIESIGGIAVKLPYHHGISTSDIIERLRIPSFHSR